MRAVLRTCIISICCAGISAVNLTHAEAQTLDYCGPPDGGWDVTLVDFFKDMLESSDPLDQVMVDSLGISGVSPDSVYHFYGTDPVSQISCAVIKQEVNEHVEGDSLPGHRVYVIIIGSAAAASFDPEQRAGEWAPLIVWSQSTGEILRAFAF